MLGSPGGWPGSRELKLAILKQKSSFSSYFKANGCGDAPTPSLYRKSCLRNPQDTPWPSHPEALQNRMEGSTYGVNFGASAAQNLERAKFGWRAGDRRRGGKFDECSPQFGAN